MNVKKNLSDAIFKNENSVKYIVMFLFSFSMIAIENIYLHMLLITLNYLQATFIFSIAMIGIAAGSFIGFYLLKLKVPAIKEISAILFFISLLVSFINITHIAYIRVPVLLMLPFIFGSITIAVIFAEGNSNVMYFTNLIGSALGVVYPVIFVRLIKSENALFLLYIVPIIGLIIYSFQYKNKIVNWASKGLSAVAAVILIVFLILNLKNPKQISTSDFENKILPSFLPQTIPTDTYNEEITEKLTASNIGELESINSVYTPNYETAYVLKENISKDDKIRAYSIIKEIELYDIFPDNTLYYQHRDILRHYDLDKTEKNYVFNNKAPEKTKEILESLGYTGEIETISKKDFEEKILTSFIPEEVSEYNFIYNYISELLTKHQKRANLSFDKILSYKDKKDVVEKFVKSGKNKNLSFIYNLYDKKVNSEVIRSYSLNDNLTDTQKKSALDTITKLDFKKIHSTSFYNYTFLTSKYVLNAKGNRYKMCGNKYDIKRAKILLNEIDYLNNVGLLYNVKKGDLLGRYMKIFNDGSRKILDDDSMLGRVTLSGDEDYINMAVDGVILDGFGTGNGSEYDPRVPRLAYQKDPKVFIVGLSADGIVKSSKLLDGAQVSGVEVNPIILDIMSNDSSYAEYSNYPYKDLEVYDGEGRSFLETTKNRYDMITLMNIHAEHGPICTLGPEYFHTVEATKLLLERLTDRGIVVYEEIILNRRGEYAYYKFLHTIKEAMLELGYEHPEDHFHIFQWDFWGGGVFRTISISSKPFTAEQLADFDEFFEKTKHFGEEIDPVTGEYIPGGDYHREKVMYSPERDINSAETYFIRESNINQVDRPRRPSDFEAWEFKENVIAKVHNKSDREFLKEKYYRFNDSYYMEQDTDQVDIDRIVSILKGINYPLNRDLRPVTDNKPFSFNVFHSKEEVLKILKIVIVMALILLIPLFVLIGFEIFKKHYHGNRWLVIPHLLYVSILGFAYMVVEIVLMQKYQKFLGAPTYSAIVTMGGLMLFSGIGSYVSKFFNRKVLYIAVGAIPVLLLLQLLFANKLFILFGSAGFGAKLFISLIMMMPLTFAMGIPFPNALEKIKRDTSNEYATLMFGISGVFSTLGSAAAIFFNVKWGYNASFLIGLICYAIGCTLLILIMNIKTKGVK